MEMIFLHTSRIENNISYSKGSVKAALIKALVTMCLQPHHACLPPYVYIMDTLQSALLDPSEEVQYFIFN